MIAGNLVSPKRVVSYNTTTDQRVAGCESEPGTPRTASVLDDVIGIGIRFNPPLFGIFFSGELSTIRFRPIAVNNRSYLGAGYSFLLIQNCRDCFDSINGVVTEKIADDQARFLDNAFVEGLQLGVISVKALLLLDVPFKLEVPSQSARQVSRCKNYSSLAILVKAVWLSPSEHSETASYTMTVLVLY